MTKTIDFSECSLDEAIFFINQANIQQIRSNISSMRPDQIIAVIKHLANKETLQHASEKTYAAITSLELHGQLEAAGKAASIPQLLNLFEAIQQKNQHKSKLLPLLVGITNDSFQQLLINASEEHLKLFQNEGTTEPIQHHLTVLSHDLHAQINLTLREIESFLTDLNSIDTQTLSQKEAKSLFYQVDAFRLKFKNLLILSTKALKIAWNTPRIDLIKAISQVKNSCSKILDQEIGYPLSSGNMPTGLYALVEKALFNTFNDSIKDDEPAAEALTRLSVWYLQDYWELGLLPQIKKVEELDNSKQSELFQAAQKSLQKQGLSTYKDLKLALVFSKKTLMEYLGS